MSLLNKEYYKIYIMYFLFGLGGLWHILDKYQNTMRFLASPLMMAVAIVLLYDIYKSLPLQSKKRFLLWSFAVFVVGWSMEYVGVRTHFPFGNYNYGSVLAPHIMHVPIVIGCAWLTILLSSLTIVQKIIVRYEINESFYKYFIPLVTALFMVIFDLIMENAAPKLGYWTWGNNRVPIQNYLSWFILGFLFTGLWLKFNIATRFNLFFGIHVYVSQMIYFVLAIFKS